MKKRIKYLIVVLFLFLFVCVTVDALFHAKEKKEKELAMEKDKIDKNKDYSITRVNNKYTVKSDKLKDKKLVNIFYDDVNVYLYYDGDHCATLLKYNIEKKKVVILYENSEEIHGGFTKIGKYYRLGNHLFDKKFKKIREYPKIEEGEFIFPSLDKVLFQTDTGISLKDLKSGEEEDALTHTDGYTYSIYSIKSDGKYLLFVREKEDKKDLIVLSNDFKIINTFPMGEDVGKSIDYFLLDGVPYLLYKEEKDEKITYKIQDTKTKDIVYKSIKDYENYIFSNTKFVCNDKDGNIRLVDYITKEEKKLFIKEKKKVLVDEFILSSDDFSLVVRLKDSDFTFYIFYL